MFPLKTLAHKGLIVDIMTIQSLPSFLQPLSSLTTTRSHELCLSTPIYLLTDGGITRQHVSVLLNGQIRRDRVGADFDDTTPLGKLGPGCFVFLASFIESIQTWYRATGVSCTHTGSHNDMMAFSYKWLFYQLISISIRMPQQFHRSLLYMLRYKSTQEVRWRTACMDRIRTPANQQLIPIFITANIQ